MKVSFFCSATLFSLATLAFPANLLQGDISDATLAEITALTEKITRDLETKQKGGYVKRAFNADAQRLSTTGDHKYVSDPTRTKDTVSHMLTISKSDRARPQRSPWTLPRSERHGKSRLSPTQRHLDNYSDDHSRK
jgi:hypothetical protein